MNKKLIIRKLNGTPDAFNPSKIFNAITLADKDNLSTEQKNHIIATIQNLIPDNVTELNVNNIHDMVIRALTEEKFIATAMNYRQYRTYRKQQEYQLTNILREMLAIKTTTNTEQNKQLIQQKIRHLQNKYAYILPIPPALITHIIINDLIHDEQFEALHYYINNQDTFKG